MRHAAREVSSYAMLRAAGMLEGALSEAALRLLFAGGMVTGRGDAGVINLDRYRELCALVPPMALFGGCTDNRVQPGKRPRSSMAPTLVFDKASGQFLLSGGSPGGGVIIHYVAKTLYGTLNWGLNPQRAIDLPNFGSLNGPSLLEEKRFPAPTVDALRTRGAEVREQNMTSGLQAIMRGTSNGQSVLLGGADPRREGVVMGD